MNEIQVTYPGISKFFPPFKNRSLKKGLESCSMFLKDILTGLWEYWKKNTDMPVQESAAEGSVAGETEGCSNPPEDSMQNRFQKYHWMSQIGAIYA